MDPYGGQRKAWVGWVCVVVSCGSVSDSVVGVAASSSLGVVVVSSAVSMFAVGFGVILVGKVVVVSSSSRGIVGAGGVVVGGVGSLSVQRIAVSVSKGLQQA